MKFYFHFPNGTFLYVAFKCIAFFGIKYVFFPFSRWYESFSVRWQKISFQKTIANMNVFC